MNSVIIGQENEVLMPYAKGKLWGYGNAEGKVIVAPKYTYTSPFKNGIGKIVNATRFGYDNKYGFVNEAGQVILEPNAREVSVIDSSGLVKIRGQNFLYGLINTNGEWILPMKYLNLEIETDFIKVENLNHEASLLNLHGKVIVDFKFSQFYFHEQQSSDSNHIVVESEGNFGLIRVLNEKFEILVEPKYKNLKALNDQFFIASSNNLYGIINSRNNTVIPFEYDSIKMQSNYIITQQHTLYQTKIKIIENVPEPDTNLIYTSKLKSRIIEKEYDDKNKIVYYLMSQEHKDRLSYRNQEALKKGIMRAQYSLFDSNGQCIISQQYGTIQVINNNLIQIGFDDGIRLYNKDGRRISEAVYYDIERSKEDLMVVRQKVEEDLIPDTHPEKFLFQILDKKHFKCGFINKTGEVIIPLIYDNANSFQNNVAAVKQNGKWALINKKGEPLTEFKYDYLYFSGENRYTFHQDTLKGLLNNGGVEIVPGTYQLTSRDSELNLHREYYEINFKNGVAEIYKIIQDPWQILKTVIDTNGSLLLPFLYSDIESINPDLFKVKYWNKEQKKVWFGIVDKNNREIIPIRQKEIGWLENEQVFKVKDENDSIVYYNEKGIVTDSPYSKIDKEELYFRKYRLLSNGFYSAEGLDRIFYFTPEGKPLFEK